jgi:glutamate racemase
MSEPGPILVFDSGVGGLSVLRAMRERLPERRYIYVADDAAFPYGDWDEAALRDHIVALMGELIAAHQPAAVVIACNTASTLVLPSLRERFPVPFVGTVPAIKPAAEQTETGIIAVLATPGTMKRVYTRDLIDKFARNCHVRLVGAPHLARLAEARMRGATVEAEAVAEQIAPCFVEIEGRRTDIVVLACTHYPFLVDVMAGLARWPVKWLDPAPAIARRLEQVLDGAWQAQKGAGFALFTSRQAPPKSLLEVLERHGVPLLGEAPRAEPASLAFDIAARLS